MTIGAINVLTNIFMTAGILTSVKDSYIAGKLIVETIGENDFKGDKADYAGVQEHISKNKELIFDEKEKEVCRKAIRIAIEKGIVPNSKQLFELMEEFKLED